MGGEDRTGESGVKRTRAIYWMIKKPTAQTLKIESSDFSSVDRWGEDCQDHSIRLREEAVFLPCSFLPFYFYYFSCQYLIATFISFESQEICFPGREVQ